MTNACCAQEEVTVVMQSYKSLTDHVAALGASLGYMPSSISTKPLQDGYFAGMDECINTCTAVAEQLRPTGTPAAASAAAAAGFEGSGSAGGAAGSSSGAVDAVRGAETKAAAAAAARGGRGGAELALVWDSDEEEGPGGQGARGRRPGGAGGLLWAGKGGLGEDGKLLVLTSNLSYLRNRMLGSLTQRFLLLLTGMREGRAKGGTERGRGKGWGGVEGAFLGTDPGGGGGRGS